ncbi:PaaX family transcriptional regulator C-terminal domain-containing protein [Spirillospora sp. NPDC047279]|uniref:PaaX family transcriptional regulator n=1 Tax=Spirillospora sp. NPDC047279 TaxID=3155478 RepID=UPI0033CFCA1E
MTSKDRLAPEDRQPAPRPQSLLLTFLGMHVLDRKVAISSGSVIEVLGAAGVSEDATRASLSRMARRGLLTRSRHGRKVYFGLTGRSTAVLRDGHDRIWSAGAVNRDWDGTWTLIGFSLPEDWRRRRHDLRSRLVWAGFGPLQNGLWIAPGRVAVPPLISGLDLDEHVNVMHAQAADPTDAGRLLHQAFDTAEIASRYRAFLAGWDKPGPAPDVPDDFTRQLLLHHDWLQLVRSDPRLPADHLPGDWPAIRAEQVFHALSHEWDAAALRHAKAGLDTVPAAPPGVGGSS